MKTGKPPRCFGKAFLLLVNELRQKPPDCAALPNTVDKLQQQVIFDAQVFMDANIWGNYKWDGVFVRGSKEKVAAAPAQKELTKKPIETKRPFLETARTCFAS